MSWKDCFPCHKVGTRPKRGKGTNIVFNPQIQMPGTPTIEGHRLAADFMAARVWKFGIDSEMDDYQLRREELLVACWWAGAFGPRKFKKRWGEWAEVAGMHLWYGCVQISDPPTEADVIVGEPIT